MSLWSCWHANTSNTCRLPPEPNILVQSMVNMDTLRNIPNINLLCFINPFTVNCIYVLLKESYYKKIFHIIINSSLLWASYLNEILTATNYQFAAWQINSLYNKINCLWDNLLPSSLVARAKPRILPRFFAIVPILPHHTLFLHSKFWKYLRIQSSKRRVGRQVFYPQPCTSVLSSQFHSLHRFDIPYPPWVPVRDYDTSRFVEIIFLLHFLFSSIPSLMGPKFLLNTLFNINFGYQFQS